MSISGFSISTYRNCEGEEYYNLEGYWHQVEEYLSDYSEVIFSHGLFEDCAKKLYPDYFSEEEKES